MEILRNEFELTAVQVLGTLIIPYCSRAAGDGHNVCLYGARPGKLQAKTAHGARRT